MTGARGASGGNGEQRSERRRLDREEGQLLLFAGAQDAARRQGKLVDGMFASFENSVLGNSSYAIKTHDGLLIARVPLEEARERLRFRRKLARKLMQKARLEVFNGSTPTVDRQTLRLQNEELRALIWAIGDGRRFPYEESETKQLLTFAVLLLCCLLPGLVYYWVGIAQPRAEYRRNLDQLVVRWRTRGKPDPPRSFFQLYDL